MIWTGPVEMRKLQIVWSRVAPTGVSTDPAVTTHHFLNLTGGNPDSTWVDADFLVVENAVDAWWGVLDSEWPTGTAIDQYRWYRASAAIDAIVPGDNPAVRIIERNLPGIATAPPLPPQVAISVTEKTALRKKWGRFYLPPCTATNMTTGGTIGGGFCDLILNTTKDMYAACRSADIMPVVYSRQNGAAYEVEKLQVDNLFDVIRSRRWKTAGYRAQHTF